MAINTNIYIILDGIGYTSKSAAYDSARIYATYMKGITVSQDSDGLYYVVQSKVISNM